MIDIYDIRDCSIAAARKFATEAAQFEKDVGRRATAAEIYCIHQQGRPGEGRGMARKAIWGNVPSDLKNKIKGGLFGGKADMTYCGNPLSRSLLGTKQTLLVAAHMSAPDPKRT